MTIQEQKHTVDHLNACLAGEISAVETYEKAVHKLDKDDHEAHVQQLQAISRDHGVAAQTLRRRIEQLDGEATNESGQWGGLANTVQSAANLVGDKSALKALKEGEQIGAKAYEKALDDGIDPQSQLVCTELLEQQRGHIARLDAMLETL